MYFDDVMKYWGGGVLGVVVFVFKQPPVMMGICQMKLMLRLIAEVLSQLTYQSGLSHVS